MHPHYLTELLMIDELKDCVEDLSAGDVIQGLERAIARRWVVSPLISSRAYAAFLAPSPLLHTPAVIRYPHSTFAMSAPGRLNDLHAVKELCDVLWRYVQLAWPAGSYVIWRVRPEAFEYDEAKDDEMLRQPMFDVEAPKPEPIPPRWRIAVRMRLCSSAGEPSPSSRPVCEGELIPQLENCK